DMENDWIIENKKKEKPLPIEVFENGDTRKQLLARSRYLLYKSQEKWTETQQERAKILFENYPDLEKAYSLTNGLRQIYNQRTVKDVAMLKLAHWFKDIENAGFESFNTLMRTITQHYNDILNYFINRSTNASTESFNAKIKNFRMQLRGVTDRKFFLFRLTQIFA
ncbi:transposase, partial [Frigoriflavimonas asaccharolytica]|uniref:transposase n=1 Tax=Frigoriflavimonas asaccharolytica TaxID=2735899 RepID=UPI0036221447